MRFPPSNYRIKEWSGRGTRLWVQVENSGDEERNFTDNLAERKNYLLAEDRTLLDKKRSEKTPTLVD